MNVTEFDQNGRVHFRFSELLQHLEFFKDLGINSTSVNQDLKDLINIIYTCVG